jgi:uncharacterized membrane protein YdbT with pleckstrin-like domain
MMTFLKQGLGLQARQARETGALQRPPRLRLSDGQVLVAVVVVVVVVVIVVVVVVFCCWLSSFLLLLLLFL